jgi:hypothetical protein
MTLYAPSQDEEVRGIENKVMARLVMASVDETSQIPHINVISPTLKRGDGDDVWRV